MSHRLSGWELEQAVRRNDKTFIESAVRKHNLDLSGINFRGRSPVTAAVVERRSEALQLLLQLGADPDGKSYEGGRRETPLITAVRLKNVSCVKILTSRGANLTLRNFYGQDAVYQAVVENALDILEHLLQLLPSEIYDHETTAACPIYLALYNAPYHPGKRKSLAMLLAFNYKCHCLESIVCDMRREGRRRACHSSSSSIRPVQVDRRRGSDVPHNNNNNNDDLIAIKVDPQVFYWISLYATPTTTARPNFPNHRIIHSSGSSSRQIIRLDLIDKTDRSGGGGRRIDGSFTHEEVVLSLVNLARAILREQCAGVAREKKISFYQVATSLPLPKKLINFLFLPQLEMKTMKE